MSKSGYLHKNVGVIPHSGDKRSRIIFVSQTYLCNPTVLLIYSKENPFENVVLDTHQYLMTAEARDCQQNPDAYLQYIRERYERDIKEVQAYVPVVCCEWCLFNSYLTGHDTKGGQSVLNGGSFRN